MTINSSKGKRTALALFAAVIIASGTIATTTMRASYAESTASVTFEQYILAQEPSLTPLVQKALSPSGNATLPQDLSDIVSLGQQLASKELAAANNAQSAGKNVLTLRYANAAVDTDRHLLNLVAQSESDSKMSSQARFAQQVSNIGGVIQNVQWKEVTIYQISKAVQRYNLTTPDSLNAAIAHVDNAKEDVQSIFADENNSTNYDSIAKLLAHASFQLETAQRELLLSWKSIESKISFIQGETAVDRLVKKLDMAANILEQKADNQKNAEATSEISTARADIQQAQEAESNGDHTSAMHDIRDAAIHLSTAAALLR